MVCDYNNTEASKSKIFRRQFFVIRRVLQTHIHMAFYPLLCCMEVWDIKKQRKKSKKQQRWIDVVSSREALHRGTVLGSYSVLSKAQGQGKLFLLVHSNRCTNKTWQCDGHVRKAGGSRETMVLSDQSYYS